MSYSVSCTLFHEHKQSIPVEYILQTAHSRCDCLIKELVTGLTGSCCITWVWQDQNMRSCICQLETGHSCRRFSYLSCLIWPKSLKVKVKCTAGSCNLDMMLYVPQGVPAPHRPPMHPLNALRNRAIAAAQTEVSQPSPRSSSALTSH